MFTTGGFAPGCSRAGVAVVRQAPDDKIEARLNTVYCPDEAIEFYQQQIQEWGESALKALGIDGKLSWSSGPSLLRPIDMYLRERYPGTMLGVPSCKSPSGNQVVQTITVALKIRQIFPGILLNETNSRLLLSALSGESYATGNVMNQWVRERFQPPLTVPIHGEEQLWALLSAYATWELLRGQWSDDLMKMGDGLILPVGEVHFFWP
jgi:hypothetical protein